MRTVKTFQVVLTPPPFPLIEMGEAGRGSSAGGKVHNPQAADRLSREVESTADREIDGLVYELYGLIEEEIKIVEGE